MNKYFVSYTKPRDSWGITQVVKVFSIDLTTVPANDVLDVFIKKIAEEENCNDWSVSIKNISRL